MLLLGAYTVPGTEQVLEETFTPCKYKGSSYYFMLPSAQGVLQYRTPLPQPVSPKWMGTDSINANRRWEGWGSISDGCSFIHHLPLCGLCTCYFIEP